MIDGLLGDAPGAAWRTYSPVLRAKTSEWKALAALSPGVRRRIAPIIEFVPNWRDPGASSSTRRRRAPQTPAEYVQRFLASCQDAVPSGTRAFAYFGLAGPDGTWSGIDLWSEFASRVPDGTRVVPLIDLGAVGTSASLTRLAGARGQLGLRLSRQDLVPGLVARIADALHALDGTAASPHLIIDLKDAPGAISHDYIRAALNGARTYATVSVLAGVFPADLSEFHPEVGRELRPRTEWSTWRGEVVATSIDDRRLGFSDYTTQCANYAPSPEVRGSVSLRYTTDDSILVFRGRQANSSAGLGNTQMHGHCRLLVRSADYAGAAFSAGDQRISCWSEPSNGHPGNQEQWRTASIVHHITQVVVQLQDAAGSSEAVRAWARGQAPAACP